jgi:hypothetical protein
MGDEETFLESVFGQNKEEILKTHVLNYLPPGGWSKGLKLEHVPDTAEELEKAKLEDQIDELNQKKKLRELEVLDRSLDLEKKQIEILKSRAELQDNGRKMIEEPKGYVDDISEGAEFENALDRECNSRRKADWSEAKINEWRERQRNDFYAKLRKKRPGG